MESLSTFTSEGDHIMLPIYQMWPTSKVKLFFNPHIHIIFSPGWSQREAVENLVRKAGYDGPCNDDLLDSINLEVYQSSKCKVTYEEWIESKEKDGSEKEK